ncbi:MAG: hypothetical protein LUE27_08180 [Clostridia bacterium]|nr:hypothetical protein [Clostridia bacterium]
MLCQRCKKNQATVDYKEIIGDKVFEYHLCPACYQEMFGGLNATNADILTDLLSPRVRKTEKRCPVCGTSYSEYQRTGLLGCPSCYDAFKTELMPAIEHLQGHTEHVGKANTNADKSGYHRKLSQLQEQLEEAIRNKEFMKANDIYEQINAINAELNPGDAAGEGGEDV